jgi:hypothetical protein
MAQFICFSYLYFDKVSPIKRKGQSNIMNIDLFTSGHGECGLLCSAELPDLPAGVIFDAETMELTIEFLEADPFHLNIQIEEDLAGGILMAKHIYIAYLIDGEIHETVMVPLLFLNDPYGGEFQNNGGLSQTIRSLKLFQEFMKRCNFAQAAHRENLENENISGSILQGKNPKALAIAPQLIRQQQMEMSPQGPSGVELGYAPPTPSGLTPMGPGGSRSGVARRSPPPKRPPPKKSDDE